MGVFDWVRNKLKSDKLKALNDAARKAQGNKDDKLTDAERQAITRDFFLSSGLDFKGQSQCCFEGKGAEVGVEVEVDPAMLLLGVFSTHMTASFNAGLTDKVLIIAQVGPPKILCNKRGMYEVPFPYLLNTCRGYSWSGGVSADIFIGVGVTAGISFDMEVAGKDFSAEAKVEAKAGLTANAGFTARHYYAEDYAPKVFADRSEAREGLKVLLVAGGNNKDYFKTQAGNLVQKNPLRTSFKSYFTSIGYSEYRSTEKFFIWLNEFIADPSSTQGMKDEALILKNNLKFIKGNIKPVISSCIRITNYCGEGGVELTASASAAANACGLVGASVEASAKACANGSYKPVTVRSQAVYPAFLRTDTNPITRFVVMTQDTRILYEKYDLSLSVAASAEIGGLGEKSEPLAKVEGNKELKRNLNRMTYITTVVYWASSVPWPQKNIKSGIGITDSLEGSGICFGGSYQLKDLAKYSKTRALVPEPLQPLWILNTLENNVDKADAAPTEPSYDDELLFDIATLESANAFNGTLESARGYDSSRDEEEKFNKHADSKFNGSKGHSVMPTLIGQALADYERQIKAWFSSQSEGSKRAHNILKRMVSENNPKLGDTVAWLIGEYSGDAAIDTAQFNDEPLRQVGGAKGYFSQKSKGDKEGRLYGLLKAKYAEAIIQDGQAAELFRQQENQFKSNEALFSQLLETRNKGVRDGNQASRTNFEAAEKVRVDGVNQESINQYNVNEAARVRAENKKIRDSFDTKQAEIQASNKAKKDEFIKKQEYIENKNALKIAMKKDIEAINTRIEIENQRYKEIYKENKFADPAHRTINYDRYSPTKVNFDDLEKKNAIIIETNKGIMARNEIEQKKWDAEYQYFKLLAANLHVSCLDLETFFASGDMKSWMEGVEDLLAMGETVLLESTFSHRPRITMISTSTGQEQKLIELEPKTAEIMLKSFKYIDVNERKLESIRMRWRIQDMANSSSNYFKLGISVFNQGGTIALKKIDEAGSEGIVDLCTVFFGDLQDVPEENFEYEPNRAARLEKAVPPTVLYCL